MTDYDELAQRVVALGVGQYDQWNKIFPYLAPESTSWDDARDFCNDGRVVLAMMEKAFPNGCIVARRGGISLAVAILTACCDALEGE